MNLKYKTLDKLIIENGILNWSRIEGVSQYIVCIDNVLYQTRATSFSLAKFSNITLEDVEVRVNIDEIKELIEYKGMKFYLLPNDTYEVYGFLDREVISIPMKFNNKNVESIGENAFYGFKNLVKIVIPDTITSIKSYAFFNCINLSFFNMPNNLEYFGSSVLANCDKLSSIILPDKHVDYENGAFTSCEGLENITIPKNQKKISNSMFSACTNLTNIIIPGNIKVVGAYAFSLCTKLKSIVCQEGVMQIGDYAFTGCVKLERIFFPKSLLTIGFQIAPGCFDLKSIVLLNPIPVQISELSISSSVKIFVLPEAVDNYKRDLFWSTFHKQILANRDENE